MAGRTTDRALTLIEVVIVVGLILIATILLSTLFPFTSGGDRVASRRADCKNAISNIGKAMYMYSEANGEFYPFFDSSLAADSLALLYPDYLPSPAALRCKNTKDAPAIKLVKGRDGTILERHFGAAAPTWPSFGYDERVGFRNTHPNTPVLADMDGSSVADETSATSNHKEGQNILYYDTHVDWKTTNTWDNPQYPGSSDNIFTADHGGGDTDAWIRR